MFGYKAHISVTCLVAGLVSLAVPDLSSGATSIKLSGSISGVVTNAVGVPQMGAAVKLYDREERLFREIHTNEKGAFTFAGLLPDSYSVRVTLATFVPAVKHHIQVLPGEIRMLNINLATLFSSIQLVPPAADQRSLMSDDWKWILRTASATRPVLRLLPSDLDHTQRGQRAAVFSNTRGVLKLSAGDGELGPAGGSAGDLGTAFALATSLFGTNSLQFSGNLRSGSESGIPSAAFRTSFTRNSGGNSPEVSVTMRQLFLPGRVGEGFAGADVGLPALRSLSVSLDDSTRLSDNLTMRYGFSMDSVSFLDRLNYFSPYARLSYSLGDNSQIDLTYTSGNARPDLAMDMSAPEAEARQSTELQRDIATLAMFPRISMREGRARVQRGENYEISYTRHFGSRIISVSGYRESVRNAALTIVAPDGFFPAGEVLPDLFSGNSVFNGGDYQTTGYTFAGTQEFGEHLSATLMYGSIGALTVNNQEMVTGSPDELRSMIRAGRRHAATARVAGTSPWTGTRFIVSYQWTDHRWAAPGHFYSTQSLRPEPGFNLYFRQPIPGLTILPWRMEATADFRNVLAQGYLPLSAAGGRRLILMQTPRVFRGGFSFIF